MPNPAYEALENSVALRLPEESLLEVRGEDRVAWLQGQVTQDLRLLRPGQPLDACICSPTGQLEAVIRLWAQTDHLLIATPHPDVVRDRVDRLVILEDVSLTALPGQLITLQGPAARGELPSDRTGRGGFDRLLAPGEARPEGIPILDDDTWNLVTLEAGRPWMGRDTDAKTLPPELGPAFVAATISYTKGCYTGQEVLMRIHSRGHTNRTWVGLRLLGPLDPGTPLAHPDRPDAGFVTRCAQSPRLGWIAAAMVRRPYDAAGTRLQAGGVEAEVTPLPFTP